MSIEISDPKCDECGRVRTEEDGEYTPLQIVFGGPLGWYSGDDGEFCGRCMAGMIAYANQGKR